jgi:poly [ADP-ribose] polymerase 1
MSTADAFFRGVHVALLGGQVRAEPSDALSARLRSMGAVVEPSVSAKTQFVVACHELSHVLLSSTRLQCLPDVDRIVDNLELALAHNVPVLDVAFVDRCAAEKRHLTPLASDRLAAIDILRARTTNMSASADAADSVLDERVQRVVRLLFDEEQLRRTLLDMNIDPDRLPGVPAVVVPAFSVLREIEKQLTRGGGAGESQLSGDDERVLQQLSDRYYDMIPHTDRTAITNLGLLRKRVELLESLSSIATGAALSSHVADDDEARRDADAASLRAFAPTDGFSESAALAASCHPLDINFRRLACDMTPLVRNSAEFDMVHRFMRGTFARSHKSLFRVQLLDVFEIERKGEVQRFETERQRRGNVHLLWHGSRLANFRGIIAQGLRIAPPEAPVSGYFLGKGVYLADMFSKSAEYCHASRERPEALMLLCEAALGNQYHTAHGKFIDAAMLKEAGFDSVLGMGTRQPRAAYNERHGGVTVPLGREGAAPCVASELDHNEFIVYDTAQVRMKYLVLVRFDWPPFDQGDDGNESDDAASE